MKPILQVLAGLFRKSKAGARGASRDFIIDYEKLLRAANAADGDEREAAEKDLQLAERESLGALVIDRGPRSGIPSRVRVVRDGGEAWLFSNLGAAAPADERRELAGFFKRSAGISVPVQWLDAWRRWFEDLAQRAPAGESIQPFQRGDDSGNAELANALAGILAWQGDSLIRYASAVICGDSKRLETLEPRLLAALRAICGETSLEDFGISHKPRTVTLHGPLELILNGHRIDFSCLPGPVALSETNLMAVSSVETSARICITVENEDVFLELAKRNPGVLLVRSGFPGSAVRRLFRLLPPGIRCHHFGDTDPSGFDILRDLREKTGRPILPLMMHPRPGPAGPPFSSHDQQTLARLLDSPVMTDLRPVLQSLLESGSKGVFEQEAVPVDQVVAAIMELHTLLQTEDAAIDDKAPAVNIHCHP
jgi:hypothetical protein